VQTSSRRVAVLIAAFVLAAFITATVGATGAGATTYTVHESMVTLSSTLEAHPKLEGFSAYSASTKQQLEKSLGIDEFLAGEYREGSAGGLISHYELELPSEAKTSVESYRSHLVAAARAVPSTEAATSVVTEDVGGEALDAAAHVVKAPDPVNVPGLLLSLDYIVVSHDVAEIQKDLSEPVEEEMSSLAVEKEAWVRVTPVSGWTETLGAELYTGGPHHPWESSGPVKIEEETINAEFGNGYFPGPAPAPPVSVGEPYYLLVLKIGGNWVAAGAVAELLSPVKGPAGWPYGNYREEYVAPHCDEGSWIRPPDIAGWPSHLKHGNFVQSSSVYEASCGESRWNGSQGYWWRTPEEMPVTFPTPEKECTGECAVYSAPSLPSVGELATRTQSEFPATGKHHALVEWLESEPLAGETPKPSPAQVLEVIENWRSHEMPTAAKELDDDDLEAAAETCIDQGIEIGGLSATESDERCAQSVIFAPGHDVATATEHDEKAIIEKPAKEILHYEPKAQKEKEVSKTWYKGLYNCEGTRPEGESCDEYPFYSSVEGGPGSSVEWIDKTDNSEEGSKYGNMVTSCGLTEGSAYVVVPVKPSLGVPTFYLCNK
jgi:hypothetical protein